MTDSRQSCAALALVPASFHDEDDEDELSAPAPFDIHTHFGLPPERPICLDSLDDPPPGQKPVYTYATLVKLAIWSSPQRRLTLSGIYQALEQRFPWFKECENPNPWKTSIRHTLSLLAVFVKLPLDLHMPGKGCFWTVDFTKGDGYKRPRKRGPASKKSSSTSSSSSHHSSRPRPRPTTQVVNSTSTFPSKPGGVPEKGWEIQRQQLGMHEMQREWQVSEEAERRVFVPNQRSVQVGAPSPDPQFRHYRMSTFLYPTELQATGEDDSNGAGPSTKTLSPSPTASSSNLCLDAAGKEREEGPGVQRRTRATQRSNPMNSNSSHGSLRSLRSNARRQASTPSSGDHLESDSDKDKNPSPSGTYVFRSDPKLPYRQGQVPDITSLKPHQLVEIASAPTFHTWSAPSATPPMYDHVKRAPIIDPTLLA